MIVIRENHLGPIFHIHRKQNKLSIAQVSEISGIAISSISEFENKKMFLESNDIKRLYNAIDIDYLNKEENHEKLRNELIKLFNCINLMEYENVLGLKNLMELKADVQCTTAFPVFVLSFFMYYTYNLNEHLDYKSMINFLNAYVEYLNEEERQIYADTLGFYYKNHYLFNEALHEFNYAIQHNINEACYAMANYHKAMILNYEGCISESLSCIKKAKKIFDRQVNIRRSISASMLMAMSYAHQEKFELANELNKQCLHAMKLVDMSDEIIWTYNNIMWNDILSGNYCDVLVNGKEALKLDDKKASYYFFMAFAEYKLSNLENAKEWIKTAKQYRDNGTEYMKLVINAFYTFLSTTFNLEKKRKKLILAYDEAVKIKDYQLEIFVLELLIELNLQENNKVSENIHLKMINNLYKNRK